MRYNVDVTHTQRPNVSVLRTADPMRDIPLRNLSPHGKEATEMRAFNTMGTCDPLKHYLVDLTDKVHKIKELVDDGKYFSISKARRYGKTTTLSALKKALSKDYTVLSVSFEGLGTECFETGRAFVRTFLASMFDGAKDNPLDVPHEISTQLATLSADEADTWALYDLMTVLRRWCRASARPLVLIIDCIDTATDSQAFRDFLSMLRADFNRRTARHGPALHSVIFSGVEDVRFLPPIAGREDNYMENSDDTRRERGRQTDHLKRRYPPVVPEREPEQLPGAEGGDQKQPDGGDEVAMVS